MENNNEIIKAIVQKHFVDAVEEICSIYRVSYDEAIIEEQEPVLNYLASRTETSVQSRYIPMTKERAVDIFTSFVNYEVGNNEFDDLLSILRDECMVTDFELKELGLGWLIE